MSGTGHSIHLILTFCTCGLWAPVWFLHWLLTRSKTVTKIPVPPQYPQQIPPGYPPQGWQQPPAPFQQPYQPQPGQQWPPQQYRR